MLVEPTPDVTPARGNWFENLLANSRYLVIVGVIASIVCGIAMLALASIDVWESVKKLASYVTFSASGPPEFQEALKDGLRADLLSGFIKAIDSFLLATVMILFGIGLYELFISRIEAFERTEFASRVLLIRSLDDLKERLSRVVMLVLVVKFMQVALEIKVGNALELLYLGLGVLMVGAALFLAGLHLGPKDDSSH